MDKLPLDLQVGWWASDYVDWMLSRVRRRAVHRSDVSICRKHLHFPWLAENTGNIGDNIVRNGNCDLTSR